MLRAHAGTRPDSTGGGVRRVPARPSPPSTPGSTSSPTPWPAPGVGRRRPPAVARTELPPPPRGTAGRGQARGRVLPRQLATERGRVRLRHQRQRSRRGLLPGGRDRRHPAPGAHRQRRRRRCGSATTATATGATRPSWPAAPTTIPPATVDEATAVLMMYTAAFTGSPNGALLSHRALVLQGSFIAQIQGVGADYVYLNCGPLFHVATFMTTLATFLVGRHQRLHPARRRRGAVPAHRRGALHGRVHHAAHHGPDRRAQRRRSLRPEDACAASPASRQWTAMITVDDEPVGQTSRRLRPDRGHGTGHLQRPAAEHRLERPAGALRAHRHARPRRRRARSPGETGEIGGARPHRHERVLQPARAQRRAPGRRLAPHQRPRAASRPTGRSPSSAPRRRLIKSAAENIYPTEVEGCLKQHPAVADAAVIGVPDRTWGQNVTAVVVLREGQTASAEEIIEHCRERIASYKKPKAVEFIDALPRNGFAVDYDALDASFGGGGYPGHGPLTRRTITGAASPSARRCAGARRGARGPTASATAARRPCSPAPRTHDRLVVAASAASPGAHHARRHRPRRRPGSPVGLDARRVGLEVSPGERRGHRAVTCTPQVASPRRGPPRERSPRSRWPPSRCSRRAVLVDDGDRRPRSAAAPTPRHHDLAGRRDSGPTTASSPPSHPPTLLNEFQAAEAAAVAHAAGLQPGLLRRHLRRAGRQVRQLHPRLARR